VKTGVNSLAKVSERLNTSKVAL